MAKNRILEAIDYDSDTKNFKYTFKKLTKSYGKDYIDLVKAMWKANGDVQSRQEFCEMNDLPIPFFEKVILKGI